MSDASPLTKDEFDSWLSSPLRDAPDADWAIITSRIRATLDAERARAERAEAARDLEQTSGVTHANYWKDRAERAEAACADLEMQLDASCNAEELRQQRERAEKAESALADTKRELESCCEREAANFEEVKLLRAEKTSLVAALDAAVAERDALRRERLSWTLDLTELADAFDLNLDIFITRHPRDQRCLSALNRVLDYARRLRAAAEGR